MRPVIAALATLALAAVPARADIPPPNASDCQGKAAGAPCKADDGAQGACKASTCTRNDYSGGVPPTQVSYDCLVCGPAAAAPDAGSAPSTQAPAAETPTPEKSAGCATLDAGALALAFALISRRFTLNRSHR